MEVIKQRFAAIAVRLRPKARWVAFASLACFIAMPMVPGLSFWPVVVRTTFGALFLLLGLLFTVVVNFHPQRGVVREPSPLEAVATPWFIRVVTAFITTMLAAFFLLAASLPFIVAYSMIAEGRGP
jgi:hypothetical protein